MHVSRKWLQWQSNQQGVQNKAKPSSLKLKFNECEPSSPFIIIQEYASLSACVSDEAENLFSKYQALPSECYFYNSCPGFRSIGCVQYIAMYPGLPIECDIWHPNILAIYPQYQSQLLCPTPGMASSHVIGI